MNLAALISYGPKLKTARNSGKRPSQEETDKLYLDYFKANLPEIRQMDLVRHIDRSDRTVSKKLQQLEKRGLIKRLRVESMGRYRTNIWALVPGKGN